MKRLILFCCLAFLGLPKLQGYDGVSLGISVIGSGSISPDRQNTYHGGAGGLVSLSLFMSRFFSLEYQPSVINLPNYTKTSDPFLFDNQLNFNIPLSLGDDWVIDLIIGGNPITTILAVFTGVCIAAADDSNSGNNCGQFLEAVPEQGFVVLGTGWRWAVDHHNFIGLRYKAILRWGKVEFRNSQVIEATYTFRL